MKTLGQELIESMEELVEYAETGRGDARVTDLALDVAEVRKKLELSRDDFGRLMGVSKRTVENWEQGRRSPSGPAVILMLIAQEQPELVKRFA